jgi:hypothetical protein
MNTFYAASSRSFQFPLAKLALGTGATSDLKTVLWRIRLAIIFGLLLFFNRENIIIRKLINKLITHSCAKNISLKYKWSAIPIYLNLSDYKKI